MIWVIALLAASPPAEGDAPSSIRLAVSAGAGDLQFSGFAGVEGETWLGPHVALGGHVSVGAQADLVCVFSCVGAPRYLGFAEPTAGLGFHDHDWTWVAGAGMGAFLFDRRGASGAGFVASGFAGGIWRPESFAKGATAGTPGKGALSLAVRGDVFGNVAWAMTLEVGFGFAL